MKQLTMENNNRKPFDGKALYEPKGKAAEYSPWAVNFYTGCSNDCEYCYLKKGVLSHIWDNKPHLKKCFNGVEHALSVFNRELEKNLAEVKKNGILFSFSTDPMLPETKELTLGAVEDAIMMGVPVKILTKRADWLYEDSFKEWIGNDAYVIKDNKKMIAFGFTLTGYDEKEPLASPNQERIEAMWQLHEMGFKTFASLEPIVSPAQTLNMFRAVAGRCDLFKIGLMSGVKKDYYKRKHMEHLWDWVQQYAKDKPEMRIYLKDSLVSYLGINRDDLPKQFVRADYNLFADD